MRGIRVDIQRKQKKNKKKPEGRRDKFRRKEAVQVKGKIK